MIGERPKEGRAHYEALVRDLALRAAEIRREGIDTETIARTLHAARRALATRFKDITPEPLRTVIHDRTVAVYGDPLGPTIEFLRAEGKSWDEIVDGAARHGPLPGP
ncbi:MAG: fhaB [Reyranella sp.]|nr:fhaB [Reyranella sp.]